MKLLGVKWMVFIRWLELILFLKWMIDVLDSWINDFCGKGIELNGNDPIV